MQVEVVGAAVVRGDCVLAARRTAPAHLAGLWEFPGGKVEPGESDEQALVRELHEELAVRIAVGARIGPELVLGERAVMRVYLATILEGEPTAVEHDALRWLSADELQDVPWIPADAPLLPVLASELRARA